MFRMLLRLVLTLRDTRVYGCRQINKKHVNKTRIGQRTSHWRSSFLYCTNSAIFFYSAFFEGRK